MGSAPEPAWWRSGVVYQIYPWSFQDSDGDGIGDLAGILPRPDHLNDGTERSLGIEAIWLSPCGAEPVRGARGRLHRRPTGRGGEGSLDRPARGPGRLRLDPLELGSLEGAIVRIDDEEDGR